MIKLSVHLIYYICLQIERKQVAAIRFQCLSLDSLQLTVLGWREMVFQPVTANQTTRKNKQTSKTKQNNSSNARLL